RLLPCPSSFPYTTLFRSLSLVKLVIIDFAFSKRFCCSNSKTSNRTILNFFTFPFCILLNRLLTLFCLIIHLQRFVIRWLFSLSFCMFSFGIGIVFLHVAPPNYDKKR